MPDEIKSGTETPPETPTPPEEHEEISEEQIKEAEKLNPEVGKQLREKKEKHEPPVGGKRWNEVYHEAKENERKVKDLETRLAERDKDVELMRQHNVQIIEALKTRPQGEVRTEQGKTPNQLMKELRDAKKQARKDLDYDKVDEIQDQIDDLMLAMREAPTEKKEDTKAVSQQTFDENEARKAVQGFWRRNDWAPRLLPDGKPNPKYDFVKAGAAAELERTLLADPSWKNRSYPELIEEVERRVTEHFAPKDTSPPSKIPAVAGIGGGGHPTPAKPTLTAEQKRVIANMFPDDPEGEKKYLEQLTIIQKRGA